MGELLAMAPGTATRPTATPMTDNLQPIADHQRGAAGPEGDPKADRERYYLLGHGSHLVDTARFLGGQIAAVRAQRRREVRRLLLVHQRRLRRRQPRASRPDDGRAHGLARGLPGLRRARQRRRSKSFNPWYFRSATSSASRPGTASTTARSARTATSSAARSRGSPTRSSTAPRCTARASRTGWRRCGCWPRSRGRRETGETVPVAKLGA